MREPTKRVLVVDDYEAWRRFICNALRERAELQVVGEASDGAEAIRLAQELKPDLILLDIGLPTLNGIEAARQIRDLSPDSWILFVSEQRSWDIAEAALRAGGNGYVFKTDAKRDLLPAVEAVLQGKRFISAGLGQHSLESSDQGLSPARRKNVVVPLPLQNATVPGRHEVVFYSDDQHLVDHVAQSIGTALRNGSAAIVGATSSHLDSILARLQANGVDLGAAIEQGRYIAFNITDAVSTFMVNGIVDPSRFLKLWRDLIATAAKATKDEHARVAIFGEGVNLLWARGDTEAAIQMEKLSNQLVATYNVDILHGYSLGDVQDGMEDDTFQRICAEHSVVHKRN